MGANSNNKEQIISCSLCKYNEMALRPTGSRLIPYEFYYICIKTNKDISYNVWNRTVNVYCRTPNSDRW